MVNWTPEQKEAIYSDGSNILVSAAAGSGKTAVLVERIIQKLLKQENPIDIDSLLVVTFTNAAAQEMRTRVGSALEEALTENPESMHLKKQLSLLQRASISTLHSFCMDTIRQYAYMIDLDPSFRIANDVEADQIKQDVIEDLFEEWYGSEGDDQERFFAVVDRFSSDRNDVDVEDLILKLYDFAIQNPWPEEWLDDLADAYYIEDEWQEGDLTWLSLIKQEVGNQLRAYETELLLAERIVNESDGPYQYAEAIESDKQMLKEALKNQDVWNDLQEVFNASKFARLSGKQTECNKDKQDKVKALRNSYKKRWEDMKKDWFTRDLASHVQDMQELAPIIKQLTLLVKQFRERFTVQKKEQAIVDFSDLEHYCLELLLDDHSTPDHHIPSSVAENLQKQYSELLVDEYQDTNLVQETILTMLSDQAGAGNMFMVGDVKQSIYRFRHAEPKLFIDKYNQYRANEALGKRIDLSSNFRSREHVLIGANYIFRQILDEELGDIDYDQDAELIYANKMYESLPLSESEPELIIIDRERSEEQGKQAVDTGDEDYEELENAQLEARAYAQKIKEWLGDQENEPLQIVDKETDTKRDIQYRDIVILMRSMTWAPAIIDEFKKQGIPIYAEINEGYFEAMEVKILINLLKIIDNPRQDIPLASVLRSPIVGLDEEELARIRLSDQRGTYYDALTKFSKQQPNDKINTKITRFLNQLKSFRESARQGELSELVWSIYRTTGYYDYVGGMPGGRQRQANLRALYDRAKGYETTSFRGLYRFLRFIERMEENNDDLGAARALSEQEDVVRMMTIHKSKGLEFPVVIVGGMNREFNFRDTQGRFILHKDLGFASKYIDPVKRITYPTLYYHALKEEKTREMLAEEMRVLYVALTRAKEKLIMVANVNSFKKKQDNWQKIADHMEWVLPAYFRSDAKTYVDWVGPALIRHKDTETLRTEELPKAVLEDIRLDPSEWKITLIHGSELANLEEQSTETDINLKEKIMEWAPLSLKEDTDLSEQVEHRLSYQYPYQHAMKARAKQSVTELKRQREFKDDYSANQLIQPYKAPIIERPSFLQKEKQLSAAEKGTALHTVMQHIPFRGNLSAVDIKEMIAGLVMKEILTEPEAESIEVEAIELFMKTDLAKYMMGVETFYRELPFSLTLPANEVYSAWQSDTEEQVLIQGVLDCVIPKDDGWIILDYKTDTIDGDVDEKVINQLINRYDTQLGLYKTAVEKIWSQPVNEVYLYFFSKQLLIQVPLEQLEQKRM